MKKLKLTLSLLVAIMLLCSCGEKNETIKKSQGEYKLSGSGEEVLYVVDGIVEKSYPVSDYVKDSDFKITKQATCQQEGEKVASITIKGVQATLKRTIPTIEHSYNDWKVTKSATFDESGIKESKCVNCGEVTEKEYNLSAKQKKQYLKENCKSYSYKTIARYPDKYNGKFAKFTGEVIQIMEDDDETTLRVNITKKGAYSTYYTDTIYVTYKQSNKGDGRILEDDIVTMYGKLQGTKSYESVLGSEVVIPAFEAFYIK
ncbi:MAG: hypothetical protein ACLRZ9_05915 [Eubacterium sp.]